MKRISFLAALAALSLSLLSASTLQAQDMNYLAGKHMKQGFDCESCHNNLPKTKAVKTDQCLSCHESYEKLAERTKGMERNPHAGHFLDLKCTQCHHGHKPSENYCDTCHKK